MPTPITVTLTGTTPLLMKSLRGMEQEDVLVKEREMLVAKGKGKGTRNATEENRLSFLDFGLAMYYDEDLGPYMPAWNVVRTLQEGAKTYRLGGTIVNAFVPTSINIPLEYRGPRTQEGLFEAGFLWRTQVNGNPSAAKKSMVYTTRPKFEDWKLSVNGWLVEEVMDKDTFIKCAFVAGLKGIGDYRARYGKFTVEVK